MHGGEALLLTPGWTSFVVVQCMVGRFSYSPQLEISGHHSVRGEEILLLVTASIGIDVRKTSLKTDGDTESGDPT